MLVSDLTLCYPSNMNLLAASTCYLWHFIQFFLTKDSHHTHMHIHVSFQCIYLYILFVGLDEMWTKWLLPRLPALFGKAWHIQGSRYWDTSSDAYVPFTEMEISSCILWQVGNDVIEFTEVTFNFLFLLTLVI